MAVWMWLLAPALAGFPVAPALDVEVVQGEAVTQFAPGHLYLVEQWATWCGPCHQIAPWLSALDNADDLTIIGISDEDAGKVERHLAKHPDQMSYVVAVDPGTEVLSAYQRIGKAQGIPHSYLVRDGEILWDGHPARVLMVLDAVRAGTWTERSAADVTKTQELVMNYFHVVDSDADKAAELGAQAVEIGAVAPGQLNRLAWDILTEVDPARRDLPLARRAAQAAVQATGSEDYSILDTYALALWEVGEKAQARQQQALAVEKCKAAQDDCVELEQRLADFTPS